MSENVDSSRLDPEPSGIDQEQGLAGHEAPPVPELDRKVIRKSRAQAAKLSKRLVRDRVKDILLARPSGSRPADQVLARAVDLYREGRIDSRKLKAAIAQLETNLRNDTPDLIVLRAPRTVSAKPTTVGLMVYETRAILEGEQQFISAMNHSVVLTENRIIFISGLLPGGTRPHLFERVFERSGSQRTLADVQLHLSALWPTLIWMRTEQRGQGRGSPLKAMMTPFGDGLLFGNLQKVTVPPAGPTVAIVSALGQQTRELRDYYGDLDGNRLWAMTNTFVDGRLLSPDLAQLRDMLHRYMRAYSDVIADNNWRWRIGLGEKDPAVAMVARTFRLTVPHNARRSAALANLEAIVTSDPWQKVAEKSLSNQAERQYRHLASVP